MDQINELPFNLFDVGVIIILFCSALFAYARGFIHEIFSIGGWIAAIVATIYCFRYVQPYARELIKMDIIADLAAGATIFLVALVSVSLLTRNISNRIRPSSSQNLKTDLKYP